MWACILYGLIAAFSTSANSHASASPSVLAPTEVSAAPRVVQLRPSPTPEPSQKTREYVLYPLGLTTTLGTTQLPGNGIKALQTTTAVLNTTQAATDAKFYDDSVFMSSTGTPLGYSGIFTFQDSSIKSERVTAITARILWNGPDEYNLWECALQRTTGTEAPIVDNRLAGDFLWSELVGSVSDSADSFVSTTGGLYMRCFTNGPNGTYDNAFIHRMELLVVEGTTQKDPQKDPQRVDGLFASHSAHPKSLSTSIGQVVAPSEGIQTLSTVTGKNEAPQNVYEFQSNGTVRKGYSGVFVFDLPAAGRNITSVALTSMWLGPEGEWNKWQFALMNFQTKTETGVLTNDGAIDWNWTMLQGNATFTYPEGGYLNGKHEMHVRYFTEGPVGTFDDSAMDSLELTVHENEVRPPRPSALPKPAVSAPAIPVRSSKDWTAGVRVCGMSLNIAVDNEAALNAKIDEYMRDGCSVVEFDTGLSNLHTDAQFAQQVAYLAMASKLAKGAGLRSVIYIPSLEVNIPGGCLKGSGAPTELSMTNDPQKSTWLQTNLAGIKNVFCGELEVWVTAGMESAWFDPNNEGFRAWFLGRIRDLAKSTDLDGYWADVPMFSDTAGSWFGAGPDSDRLFALWSKKQGLNQGKGYSACPSVQDADSRQLNYRAWLRWRHETLADWQESIRVAAEEVRPTFKVIAEVYPMDYLDPLWTGLDAVRRNDSLLRVWEVDSVSNTNGMEYSTREDFRTKIALNKYARAADSDTPSWVFAYGNKDLDTGLVMGAAVASGCGVFECKTPSMTTSVGSEFRRRWMTWIERMDAVLFDRPRRADVGVIHSAATRNHYDHPNGGAYGMYLESTKTPATDDSWWAVAGPNSSLIKMKHVGAYKGMMGALTQLQVPHKVILDHTDGMQSLEGLKVLILPSVAAMSEASAVNIRWFVYRGGAVFATGTVPGTLDEDGTPRNQSVLADMFQFGTQPGAATRARVSSYGKGVAVYRPDIGVRELFNGEAEAVPEGPASVSARAKTMDQIKLFIRTHVAEDVIVQRLLPDGTTAATTKLYLEVGEASTDSSTQALYLLNLDGLKVPVMTSPMTVRVYYRAPAGTQLKGSVGVHSPDVSQWVGGVVAQRVNQPGSASEERAEALLGLWYYFDLTVDQFSVMVVHLEPCTPPTLPAVSAPLLAGAWKDTVTEGLSFIKTKMRNHNLFIPFRYGVYTNYIDILPSEEDVVYANGHHTTAEHMGLFLRTAACLKDAEAHAEATRYIREVMTSKLLGLTNWAIDKDTRGPLIQASGDGRSVNANAPLDDLRVVRGLMEGAAQFPNEGVVTMQAAETALTGLYWTSVADVMAYDASDEEAEDIRVFVLPQYKGGVMGYAYDWSETEDSASGDGVLGVELIPIDYSYLTTMALAARVNPRWLSTLEAATRMLLDSEIGKSGLFYNGLKTTKGKLGYTGDFEYRNLTESNRGRHLKTIQTMWIALHLGEIGISTGGGLSSDLTRLAKAAALRSLEAFHKFYTVNDKRIPEYMTVEGTDVTSDSKYPLELDENLWIGEARIYSQFANLAYTLNRHDIAIDIMNERVISDRVTSPTSPVRGCIGVSASTDNCEAFNTLEALNRMCIVAQGESLSVAPK
ncbi:hypothetical protein SARC_10074 [Sphaeroforma arctica JP610]|uniref:Glycosyl-hydrolase 114-associated domain-containing protein n=1 Tax=Sphaeroforma arctica JP610 TaxID=667725 RepID=A0A0L0FN60_9EUKA|nr:hypothetical protein SARC_10074 [Sphaeroforma arctica JP610]KNC77463.1 hypothetical protein SARC_10074 [Sphaeroforma arctica JP610]|eukprot:XP_014151365.1 hypothetical protein SARC_10074 [Sphaeroforma arctica JP610]